MAEWYPNKPKQNDVAKPIRPKPVKLRGPRPRKARVRAKPAKDKTQATPGMSYQAFVSERSKAGKNLKEISAEWRDFKASMKE